MSISIEAGVRPGRPVIWKTWIAGLAIGAVIGAAGASAVVVKLDRSHSVGPPAHTIHVVPLGHGFVVPAITGTGPDLTEVADESRASQHVDVTGTGPDLIQVAGRGH